MRKPDAHVHALRDGRLVDELRVRHVRDELDALKRHEHGRAPGGEGGGARQWDSRTGDTTAHMIESRRGMAVSKDDFKTDFGTRFFLVLPSRPSWNACYWHGKQ